MTQHRAFPSVYADIGITGITSHLLYFRCSQPGDSLTFNLQYLRRLGQGIVYG